MSTTARHSLGRFLGTFGDEVICQVDTHRSLTSINHRNYHSSPSWECTVQRLFSVLPIALVMLPLAVLAVLGMQLP